MAPRGEPSASVGPQPGARGDDYSRYVVTALYRRYRPETFAEVIGQEHVTEPLSQALRSGRLHHAYLFSGPRGCGKTTSLNMAVGLLRPDSGNAFVFGVDVWADPLRAKALLGVN